jgi:hypothetical protein
MKKLILILCVLMASQVFSQRVFYRNAMKADTLTVNYTFSAYDITTTAKATVGWNMVVGDSLRVNKTTILNGVATIKVAKLPKHTLAAGDSVQGTLFCSSSDSSLWMWNGTAWNKYATLASPTFTGTVGAVTITATTINPTHMTLALHAIALGDSVFGNTVLRNTDTVLVMWNGTAWKTIADVGP